jgi:hypothetical protein
MQKYIKLFEDFGSSELKDLQADSNSNWNSVRDSIQSLHDFTIINFKNRDGYLSFLDNCGEDCVKQSYYTGFGKGVKRCPSVFINSVKNLTDDEVKQYGVINHVIGKQGDPNIELKIDGKTETIGNEVVSTLSQNEVYPEDHFKLGSVFYKFINFFS